MSTTKRTRTASLKTGLNNGRLLAKSKAQWRAEKCLSKRKNRNKKTFFVDSKWPAILRTTNNLTWTLSLSLSLSPDIKKSADIVSSTGCRTHMKQERESVTFQPTTIYSTDSMNPSGWFYVGTNVFIHFLCIRSIRKPSSRLPSSDTHISQSYLEREFIHGNPMRMNQNTNKQTSIHSHSGSNNQRCWNVIDSNLFSM